MKLNQASRLLAVVLLPLSTLWLRAADDAAPTVTQTAHTETVNRQQLSLNANQAISDGERFLGSGDYDQAADRFQYALDALTPGGVSAVSYNRAETGLAAAKAGQAQELAKDFKFAEAAALLQQAVILQPNNPVYPADIEDLKKQQLAYEEEVRDPEGTTNNPAVTDEFKSRVATVQKLLFQGDAYFRTGQYEKAEVTYSKILLLDPYNSAARKKMAKMDLYKTRAAGFRHEEYEGAAMENVDHGWAQAISPDIVQAPVSSAGASVSSNRAKIQRKLESIIIDKVNFDKLDIATVIQYLQQKSKELDPDHEGVNFVLRLTADTAVAPDATGATPAPAAGAAPGTDATAPHPIHREVSITLSDVPLSDILGYVIAQTNLKYSVEDYAVYLRPSIDEGETLTVRTFLVPPDFFTGSTLSVSIGATTDEQPTTVDSVSIKVQQQLSDKGIRFPPGATATFLPGSSKLVVRDTPEQLDLISNLIDQLSQETPQISIEAKLAEFNQDAIKGLSFNYVAGSGVFTNTVSPASNFGVGTFLRTSNYASITGNGGLTPDDINNLIQSNPDTAGGIAEVNPLTGGPTSNNTPSVATLGVVIDGTGVAAIISALNNLQGTSLLSAPNVTTQNGQEAQIEIVREFPYPSSFDKPKLSNSSNLAYSSGPFANVALVLAIPPTPREFVTQDVGVSLKVKPTTYPDQRIDLDITEAKVLDFDGFIDYGVPIVTRAEEDVPPEADEGSILTLGVINQPVFNSRSMATTLQVLDGQTAVLGGLTREDTQEINDKVPVLGDVPLVGRLFQSKVSERTKKSLLWFITARLVRSNGKPEYVKTLDAEPQEEALPEPDSIDVPGANLPPLPEETPNS